MPPFFDQIGESNLEQASQSFQRFVDAIPSEARVVILCDGDVDGLGAGVLVWHFLARRGLAPEGLPALQPAQGENAFTQATVSRLAGLEPSRLFVLDLGVSSRPMLPGVGTLLVDHHRPTGEPADAITISGYTWDPVPTSSLLTYLLCNAQGEMADKAWVATVGNLGDLGPSHPELEAAALAQKKKWLREATTILNAAKRSRLYATDAAFSALRHAESAREIAEGDTPHIRLLRECREEVKAALEAAKRLAPRFSKTEKVALLEFSSPSRIHPLLAQSWHGRLKGFIVVAANRGFLPAKVSFSVRTSTGANLIEFLARFRDVVGSEEPEYGHGHDQAAGGVISHEAWERLKGAMGFAG